MLFFFLSFLSLSTGRRTEDHAEGLGPISLGAREVGIATTVQTLWGARVDLLASTTFNKLPLPPTASMTAPRSRIRPRPRSSCIMTMVICCRISVYPVTSSAAREGAMDGRSLPIPRTCRFVLSASHPPFLIDASISPMLVLSRLGAHHTIPRAALISCSTRVVD